jgi:hypothetical protein
MLNVSLIMVQLTIVTYTFGNMEADNVEYLYNQRTSHKCYL